MPTVRLTKSVIEAAAAQAKDHYLWDASLSGFGVKITPNGTRTYLVQYRPRGVPAALAKTRRFTIGKHGSPWTIDAARDRARDLLARVRMGEDPADALIVARTREREEAERMAAAAEAARLQAEEDTRLAFENVLRQFIDKHASGNRTGGEAKRILKKDAEPAWMGRAISTITKRDVIELVDAVGDRSPGAARLLFAHVRKLFNWCVDRGYIDTSPCTGLKGPSPTRARDRWLSDDEIRLIWLACTDLGEPYGPLIKLLLLTAQRRGEVSCMDWSEVDLERSEWIIPSARAKNGRAHAVDLSPQAAAILKDRTPKKGAVFKSSEGTPVSAHSDARERLDDFIEARRALEAEARGEEPPLEALPEWRLHDLRRTAATHMSRLGVRREVIEAVLNHQSVVRGGLVAVYQHYDHRAERKAALFEWADYVASLVAADEIDDKSVT